MTSTVAALSVLAPSVVIARTRVLPRWLIVLAAIEIAFNVAEITGFFVRSGWNTAGWASGIGPLAWVVWLAAVSITMMVSRSGGATVEIAQAEAEADIRIPAERPRSAST